MNPACMFIECHLGQEMKKGALATHIPPNPKIIIGEQNIYIYP